MGEHHALRVPGGARGVQDRQRVLRAHGAPQVVVPAGSAPAPRGRARAGRSSPRTGGRRRERGVVDDHDRGDARALLEREPPTGELVGPLEHDHRRLGVAGDVGDLLRRQGRVDGHRGPARVHLGEVGEDVLGPVRGHHRDRVVRREPECDVAGREVEGLLPDLVPRQRPPASPTPTLSEYAGARPLRDGPASAVQNVRPSIRRSISRALLQDVAHAWSPFRGSGGRWDS